MAENKDALVNLKSQLLSNKLSTEYAISCSDYPSESDPAEIIMDAYNKASALFDADSDSCISNSTLDFYALHMDEAIEAFTKNLEGLAAVAKLLPAFFKIQSLLNSGPDALKEKLSSELIDNRDYYELFSLNYFLELGRTDGLTTALSELENDVNIRANTYYNAAYADYLDLLPGFDDVIDTITSSDKI